MDFSVNGLGDTQKSAKGMEPFKETMREHCIKHNYVLDRVLKSYSTEII